MTRVPDYFQQSTIKDKQVSAIWRGIGFIILVGLTIGAFWLAGYLLDLNAAQPFLPFREICVRMLLPSTALSAQLHHREQQFLRRATPHKADQYIFQVHSATSSLGSLIPSRLIIRSNIVR